MRGRRPLSHGKLKASQCRGRGVSVALAVMLLIALTGVEASADRGFEFVLIKELRGEVVDNDTGMRVDNFVIEGEIHSTVIYFRIEFSSGFYSYWVWDENGKPLRSAENLRASGSDPWQFVLPVGDLLDNGEHFFQVTVFSPGYSTLIMSGSFQGRDCPALKITLSRLSNGSFDMSLGRSEVTVTRRHETASSTVERTVRYPESGWIPRESASSRIAEIRSRGREPLFENVTTTGQTGWRKLVVVESSAQAADYQAGGYRVTTETSYQQYEVVVGYNVRVETENWVRSPSEDYYASNVPEGDHSSWKTGWYSPCGEYKYYYYKSTYCTLTGYTLYLKVTDWGGIVQYYETKWVSLSEYNSKWADGGDSDGLWFGYKWVVSKTPTYSNYIGYSCYRRTWNYAGDRYVTVSEYSSPPAGTRYLNPVPVKETRYTTVTRWVIWEPVYGQVTGEYLVGERWTETISGGHWVSDPEIVEVPLYLSANCWDNAPVSLSASGLP